MVPFPLWVAGVWSRLRGRIVHEALSIVFYLEKGQKKEKLVSNGRGVRRIRNAVKT